MPEPAPYRFGVDDRGEPYGADNPYVADPNDPTSEDPTASEGAYRAAVLNLLAEIRDLLLAEEQ